MTAYFYNSYFIFALSLLVPVSYGSNQSKGVCSSPGYACLNSEDSFINTFHKIQSIEDCHQLCLDQKGCSYVSYYGENSNQKLLNTDNRKRKIELDDLEKQLIQTKKRKYS